MKAEEAKSILDRLDSKTKILIGSMLEECLLTGEDRPAAELVDKLDKYERREKEYQEWWALSLALQEDK